MTLPLSLELLNRQPSVPESKQEDLHSGFLQVPHGTTMLITEDGVREGKLVEQGTEVLLCLIAPSVFMNARCPQRDGDTKSNELPRSDLQISF